MLLKLIVIFIALISVAMVTALFTKKEYTLKREIVINRPKDGVFDYIRYLKNQEDYSKWLKLDPNTKIEYKGAPDGKPGAILAFSSKDNRTGTGEWETKNIIENNKLDFELRFLKPFKFTAGGHMAVYPVSPDETRLEWVYNSGMNWPMNFMLLFLDMDKLVGNDIAFSLQNIKRNLESRAVKKS